MIPPVDEQRRLFREWDSSPQQQAYREVRRAGGGHVGTEQERWELFARRWRPTDAPSDWSPPSLHETGSQIASDGVSASTPTSSTGER